MMASVHLLLLAALPALLGQGAGGVEGEVVSLTGRPQFAPRQQTRLRAVQGRSVTLECRVLQQGDKAVSWVRARDLQILAHGGAVFTADARVSVPAVRAARAGHAHALRIDRLRDTDAGRYECQLNTEPKMSLFFELSVIDEEEVDMTTEAATSPEPWGWEEVAVWAVGPAHAHVPAGGTAELACAARVLAEPLDAAPPLDIRWLRDGKPVTLQDGCAVSRLAGATYAESRLRLVAVRARDTGQYACAVGAQVATLHLTVTDTESLGEMEAMQRDQSAGGSNSASTARDPPHGLRAAFTLILIRFIAF